MRSPALLLVAVLIGPAWGQETFELPFVSADSGLGALAFQADGSIVAGGSIQADLAIVRVVDGVGDPAFGTNGVVQTPILGGGAVRHVALQSDGAIVVAGHAGGDLLLARYTAGGTLDPTFGMSGIVVDAAADEATGLALQPDGAIVAATPDAVVRYLFDGSPDPSFGIGGVVDAPAGVTVTALVLQPDAAVVAAGETADTLWLARLLSDGSLDPTFGTAGIVTTTVGLNARLIGMARQPDGRLVVVGRGGGQNVLARYSNDGSLDPTFGDAGVAAVDGLSQIVGISLEPAGRIVLSENRVIIIPPTPNPFRFGVLHRYLANGAVDPSAAPISLGFGQERSLAAIGTDAMGRIATAGISFFFDSPGHGVLATFGVLDVFGRCVFDAEPVPCDDGNACTDDDTYQCSTDVCAGQLRTTDAPCLACDPDTGELVGQVRTGCKRATLPRRSKLTLKNASSLHGDALSWRLTKGEATTLAELGDPVGASPDAQTQYDLCMFDESGPTSVLVFAATARSHECSRPPCWKATSRGLRYASAPNASGLTRMTLTAGASALNVTGKGSALFAPNESMPSPPSLPFALPLRAQLRASDGVCWEATFSPAGVRTNTAAKLVATSD